jgi:hypothetical protein
VQQSCVLLLVTNLEHIERAVVGVGGRLIDVGILAACVAVASLLQGDGRLSDRRSR